MWYKNRNAALVVKRFYAFSLTEILLSLSLGSILLLAASSLYADFHYTQHKQRELLHVQRNTHQLLDYLQQHIQHIGFQGTFRQASNYPLFANHGKPYALNDQRCLVFFYDLNGDGCIGNRAKTQACHRSNLNSTTDVSKELWGIKLEGKTLAVYEDSAVQGCHKSECEKVLTDCRLGNWRKFSEMADYQVEELTFEWITFERVLKTTLTLSSITQPDIQYHASAYSYLFNAKDW